MCKICIFADFLNHKVNNLKYLIIFNKASKTLISVQNNRINKCLVETLKLPDNVNLIVTKLT